MTIVTKFAVALVGSYKRFGSPLFPPSCRYVPTCSEYAEEAIARYGALRGCFLVVGRVLRCHPFVRGGYDPVVDRTGRNAETSTPWLSALTADRRQRDLNRNGN